MTDLELGAMSSGKDSTDQPSPICRSSFIMGGYCRLACTICVSFAASDLKGAGEV